MAESGNLLEQEYFYLSHEGEAVDDSVTWRHFHNNKAVLDRFGVNYADRPTYDGVLMDGKDGRDGRDGVDGADGKNGYNGRDGIDGEAGADGLDGTNGRNGEAATITIGTTTTLDPGLPASVENVGTDKDAILNFGIPKGADGTGGGGGVDPARVDALEADNTAQWVKINNTDVRVTALEAGGGQLDPTQLEQLTAILAWANAILSVEYWTGKLHIDGRKVYGKRIECNPLGTTTTGSTKLFPHGVLQMDIAVSITGYWKAISTGLPTVYALNNSMQAAASQVGAFCDRTNISIQQGNAKDAYFGICTIEYVCLDR